MNKIVGHRNRGMTRHDPFNKIVGIVRTLCEGIESIPFKMVALRHVLVQRDGKEW